MANELAPMCHHRNQGELGEVAAAFGKTDGGMMIPETFRICRERTAGGVLNGIFHHSMSLHGAA